MDGQAPSPLMHTPIQRPYPYHPNAQFPYTQQQPYPSPLSTNPTRPLHTPHPYNPQQRPIHPLPNGHSPKFPMTPPYPPYLNGPIQTPPPSSSGSEALPSNQIHIMQTTPQAVMLRSNSTLSTTSTNRPPPLSNGPSPAVEEVIVDMSDQYDMYPAQQAQMRQVVAGPRMGMDQVQARAVVNATRPNEMDGVPRQMVVSQQIPIPNASPSTGVIPASESGMGNLWQSMLFCSFHLCFHVFAFARYSYQTIAMEFLLFSPLSPIPTAQIDITNRDDVLGTPSQSTIDSLFNTLAAVTGNATTCDVEIDQTLIDRPLGEGTGLRVVANFLEGLGAMQSRGLEDWLSFIISHFENNSRFQLVLTGEQFQMFDVPTTYLPRFFLSLPSSPSIILTDPIESLPSTEETMVLCPDMEWRCGAKSWKGALNMVVGRRGKIEKMDVVLGNKNDEGEMFLKGALRVLKMAQEMESFALVMRLAQQENLPPREALQQFIQEE
ncbi:hypothetical protein D1P53_002042 [Cryptococcus gattii VGV]|nr:hypothetical protein D1P53_002042 [Cryptococcus gattii VGV]